MKEIRMIQIYQLYSFKNHPFHVETDQELHDLAKSIEQEGILVPLLARPRKSGTGYELISGHRRARAGHLAGLKEVPVIVCDMTDDQAVIAMVDSNMHREHLLPSEKAFAYKMKLEAMKHHSNRICVFNLCEDKILPRQLSRNYASRRFFYDVSKEELLILLKSELELFPEFVNHPSLDDPQYIEHILGKNEGDVKIIFDNIIANPDLIENKEYKLKVIIFFSCFGIQNRSV